MELVVSLDHRFVRTPDGAIRTATSHARAWWDRYLRVFDRVRVVARVADVDGDALGMPRADGDGVAFEALPTYVGPRDYLRQRGAVNAAIRAIDLRGAAVLMRAPGMATSLLSRALPAGQPFGLEVISDPHESLRRGCVSHPLRPFFRVWFRRDLRQLCSSASTVLYVTQAALQRSYPSNGRSAGISDVDLPDDAFAAGPRPQQGAGGLRLIAVAMLEQPYKRIDDLLHAVALCRREGDDTTLTVVGNGALLPSLRQLASSLGLDGAVTFTGAVPGGAAVRALLDAHDVFVMPSQTEGLPRALVEAMARGLPCIATAVGGIPELLDARALVPPRNVVALAARIGAFADDPALRSSVAARLFRESSRYAASRLQPLRDDFLRHLKRITHAFHGVRLEGAALRRELA